MTDPDNWRLRTCPQGERSNELGWHTDHGSLLRILYDPSIEPTNNRAEQALRPAVIVGKVSQRAKTTSGTEAFPAFTGVIRTSA